jgi:hypothetical protein
MKLGIINSAFLRAGRLASLVDVQSTLEPKPFSLPMNRSAELLLGPAMGMVLCASRLEAATKTQGPSDSA